MNLEKYGTFKYTVIVPVGQLINKCQHKLDSWLPDGLEVTVTVVAGTGSKLP